MAYLNYISDKDLILHTKHLLELAYSARITAAKQFSKNVIDPFSLIFEMSAFNVDHSDWRTSELQRQSQKTLSNGLGKVRQTSLQALTAGMI